MPQTFFLSQCFIISIHSSLVIACDEGTFGASCSSTCGCIEANTLSCDTVTGDCNCKSGWTGTTCDTDVFECADSNLFTCQGNSTCVEEPGSYSCQCDSGFQLVETNTCQGKIRYPYITVSMLHYLLSCQF